MLMLTCLRLTSVRRKLQPRPRMMRVSVRSTDASAYPSLCEEFTHFWTLDSQLLRCECICTAFTPLVPNLSKS